MAKHPVQMTSEMMETGALAIALWLARRDQRSHPDGTFDNAGRFRPSADEDADGYARFVRPPSHRWPNSYNVAARTRAHCLALTLKNRPFVERLVAAGNLLDQVDDHARRLGAGWVLREARYEHDVEFNRRIEEQDRLDALDAEVAAILGE